MKPFPWKCGECRQKAVHPVKLPEYSVPMEHDGRTYQVSVKDFDVLECRECGAIEITDESGERLSEAYRQAVGLLSSAEIRARRIGLGLSQKQLAEALKISESTLSRWETGAQIQQRSLDLLLRLVFELPTVREHLKMPAAKDGETKIYAIEPQAVNVASTATSKPPHHRDDPKWHFVMDHIGPDPDQFVIQPQLRPTGS